MKGQVLRRIAFSAVFLLLVTTGCNTLEPKRGEPLDPIHASLEDVRMAMPGKPNTAAYQFDLQQRIQASWEEEFRIMRNEHVRVGNHRALSLTVVVFADGHIGVRDPEVRRLRRQEPLLADVVLRALIPVSEHPVPFPAEVVQEAGPSFVYRAHAGIR